MKLEPCQECKGAGCKKCGNQGVVVKVEKPKPLGEWMDDFVRRVLGEE